MTSVQAAARVRYARAVTDPDFVRHAPTDRALYALALLCIACGHQAVGDETLDQTEIDKATELVHRWRPEASAQQIGSVLAKAMELYMSIGAEADALRRANVCATLVKRDFPEDAFEPILNDLSDIVAADGIMSPAEADFVDAVRAVFVGG